MNYQILSKYLLFIFILLLYSCNKENAFDCVKSTGPNKKQLVETEDFHSISTHDNLDLVIKQGNETSILLESGKNLIPKITFEVKDQVLYIKNENTCNWVREFKNPKVYITLPTLKTLYHEGYGDITSDGELTFNDFEIVCNNGNGDISLTLDSENLFIFSRTSAVINLRGKAAYLNLHFVENNGKFEGEEFMIENASIAHFGLNTLHIFPVQSLEVTIGHSGNVMYYNDPEVLSSLINGNGQLIKKF